MKCGKDERTGEIEERTVSRVGKSPITIPGGVTVDVNDGVVKVSGPKGELQQDYDPRIQIAVEDGTVTVTRPNDDREMRSKHGLVRALIGNMVVGVTDGWTRELEIQGVGYRAAMSGKNLSLSVGHSHPVEIVPPEGIEFTVDGTTNIKVSGIDKQLVGQIAANVRAWRKPEPYKGKGVRYKDEYVRRKVGKTGTK